MDKQMKQRLNNLVDRINSLNASARKLRRAARDDDALTLSIANEYVARSIGILEAIEAIAGCQPARKMPEDIYLHF